jgi:cobalt-zinc-cadmium efflux system membrane fusion protein
MRAATPVVRRSRGALVGGGWTSRATLVVAALTLTAAGCRGGRSQDRGSAPADAGQPSLFTLPANQLPHLRIARVRKTSWSVTIRTTGTADWDADHTTQAITQVSGPITRIAVDLGTRVNAGDPLLFVSSPDLSSAVSTYRKAQNRLDLARRTLDRNRDLLDHRAIAQKDFEASQADYNDAFTEVQNDLDTLRIFGVTEKEIEEANRQNAGIRPELTMRSPISGTVVQKLVLPGQVIQAGATACFVITDTATMWVQGHLHETELTSIHTGDAAEVRNPSLPRAFHGVVSYIGAMLDPATRTTPVRIVTRNQGDLLKKDLFVDVVIQSGATRDVLVVPTSAVLYNSENFPFVYLEVTPGRFAQRLIKTGGQQDDEFEVLDGVKEGDPIVTQGSVFVQFAETTER